VCIRLYAEDDYDHRPEYTLPEIQRANLAEVILRMIALKLGDPAAFPFIDPPHPRAIKDGFGTLTELGAIDADKKLTPAGRVMARLPLDPRVSRMLLEASQNGALREVAIIAAGLSVQDPRERPAEKRPQADQAHARFRVPDSDFLAYLKIWDAYHDTLERLKSQGKMRRFCKDHFLSFNRMREWRDIHEQITGVLKAERGFTMNREDADFAAIHKAILSGHLRNIGLKKEKAVYLGAQNQVLTVFPGSGQVRRAGRWIVAGELVETSRLFARTVATIEEAWLEELGGDLCRRGYAEPHWEKNRGQVVATERVTLFGLPIVAGRKVDYGRIDPAAAREIFLRSALVEGELKGSFGFLAHNRALLDDIDALESRLRRRGLSPDDETLYAFYDQRVGDVCDQRSFARMLKERGSDAFLRLKEEDLLAATPEQEELEPFPETLKVGDVELALTYRFEPGRDDDGVSVAVPASLASHLPTEAFEWVVPGLLEEKVAFLLKGLPKRLRRFLIPVPRTAAELLEELERGRGSLYAQLQDLLVRRFRLRIQRSDWPLDSLPPHLAVRYCLQGPGGETVVATRSYAELLAACDPNRGNRTGNGSGGAVAVSEDARRQWEREGLTDYDLPDLPERVSLGPSPVGVEGFAFPGLAREEGRVALRLFATRAESVEATRAGLPALYAARFAGEISVLRKDLAIPRTRWPLFEGLGSQEAVGRDLLAFVLAEVFETRDGKLPARAAFRARVESLKGGALFNHAREVRDRVMKVLGLRRQVLDLLAKHRRGARADAARVPALRGELERILPGDFLHTLHAGRLPDVLRYLKALHVRIERAHLSPAKEAERQAQVEPHLERLAAARAAGPLTADQDALIDAFARMLEEYRISLFAQEVRTAFPISAKRLDRKWEEIRGAIEIRSGR
jgi:ATP-dependent helicase HrpA